MISPLPKLNSFENSSCQLVLTEKTRGWRGLIVVQNIRLGLYKKIFIPRVFPLWMVSRKNLEKYSLSLLLLESNRWGHLLLNFFPEILLKIGNFVKNRQKSLKILILLVGKGVSNFIGLPQSNLFFSTGQKLTNLNLEIGLRSMRCSVPQKSQFSGRGFW